MFPVLFRFGRNSEHVVTTYGVALLVAVGVAIVLGLQSARQQGLTRRRVLLCLIPAAIATLPGARLWHILLHPSIYRENPDLAWHLSAVGLGLFGGASLGCFCGMLCGLWMRLPLRTLADAILPSVLVAAAVLKLGCFGQGCCYGRATSAPWGVRFSVASPVGLHFAAQNPLTLLTGPPPIHPVQLYEAVAYLAAVVLVTKCIQTRTPGVYAAWCILAMSTVHFVSLQLRDLTAQSEIAVILSLAADFLLMISAAVTITLHRVID
jgi:phosphatidylglycerol---prolipoprotein diacylglyceryl transferase